MSWQNHKITLPETNSKFAPKNGWLEYDPFLLGSRPIFRGEMLVSGRVSMFIGFIALFLVKIMATSDDRISPKM